MSHTISPFFENIYNIPCYCSVSHRDFFFNSMLKYLAFCWNADIRKDMNKNTNEFYIPEKIILSKEKYLAE